MAQALRQRYPTLPIDLTPHPPTPSQAALAKLITIVQYGTILFAVFSPQITEALGITLSPELQASLAQSKWTIVAGAFFLGNSIINSIVSTGAFEVMYGTDLLFSKLESGRMPTNVEEIVTLVHAAMAATL